MELKKLESCLDFWGGIYKALKNGAEHHFEFELNHFEEDRHLQGVIDLLYFDKDKDSWVIIDFKSNNISYKKDLEKFAKDQGYDKQLETYEKLCEISGFSVGKKVLLFLDSGDEVEI